VVIGTVFVIIIIGFRKYFKIKKLNKKSAMVSATRGES
jgi:hypothetical protein